MLHKVELFRLAAKSGARFGTKALIMAVMLGGLTAMAPAPAKAEKATTFMKRFARDMVAASRVRSVTAIGGAIRKHGDVKGIGRDSLGSRYKNRLGKQRSTFQNGMVRDMARIATSQLPKFSIKSYKILRSYRSRYRGRVNVDSIVTLNNGTSYNVTWELVKKGRSYKVRDVLVYGYRMTLLLQDRYVSFISDKKKGGSVRALVAVLSR